MAGNVTGYPSSSPPSSSKRSPTSSDQGRLGSCSSADQTPPSALTASPYQASHGSMESLSHDLGQNARTNAEPAELWLSDKENEDPWPVVICDEEMLGTLLEGKFRPVNARQEDGSWYRGYGAGGGLAEQRCFPTLRLGTPKLCWTPWNRLLPFDILDMKSIQESAEDLELVKAYAEAIEQYGRNDLTYWKDKLLARQLSNADALEPVDMKIDTDAVTTKRKQQLPNGAARQPANVEKKTHKRRKIGKRGFKYPPKVIAGIKVWGSDEMSDSGDEAVREYKKIKLEHEKDGDSFLFSAPQSQAPILQDSKVEEEDINTKESLKTTSSVNKKIKLEDDEDDKDDSLFLSPPQSQASGQRVSNPNTYSGTFWRDRTPIEHLPTVPDRRPKSVRFTSPSTIISSSPRFVRTQNSPSRPFFEKIVSPATTNSPSQPPLERFISPSEPYHPSRQDTLIESSAKPSARLLSPSPQQSEKPQASPANSSTPPKHITLYIGNPHTPFLIPLSSLPLSPHLLTNLSHDPTVGAYIMSPLLASIQPPDFPPIAAFLNDPSSTLTCHAPTQPGPDPVAEFRKCALTFHIATQLGIDTLAAHQLAKIRITPSREWLSVVRDLLSQGVLCEGGGLRAMAVRYLAERYWELMRMDGDAVGEVLAADRGFEREVYEGAWGRGKRRERREREERGLSGRGSESWKGA